MDPHTPSHSEPQIAQDAGVPVQRVVRLEELLGDDREVLIQHGSEYYRLRLTRNGRLLLTK
jgi:hemin uptake protein HemP